MPRMDHATLIAEHYMANFTSPKEEVVIAVLGRATVTHEQLEDWKRRFPQMYLGGLIKPEPPTVFKQTPLVTLDDN